MGDFHCNSGHFSISPLARYNHLRVKTLAHGNFSLVCGCYRNLVLFEATEVVCSDRIFYTHVLYNEVLVSLQNTALTLVISLKNTNFEAFLIRKTKDKMTDQAPSLIVKVSTNRFCEYQPFSFD